MLVAGEGSREIVSKIFLVVVLVVVRGGEGTGGVAGTGRWEKG